jgi:methylenetetrahydrofolate reductase (NADPH)
MCAKLEEEGFSHFHFYTSNHAELTVAVCRVLGVKTEAAHD